MIYLSKGIVKQGSTEQLLFVLRGGQEYELTGMEAAVWLNGRFAIAQTQEPKALYALERLRKIGLAEVEANNDAISRYQIATRCVFCLADRRPSLPYSTIDAFFLMWMRNAGLRLTVAELIYLYVNNIQVSPELCSEHNRQALVERIYTADTIADNILENKMAHEPVRDEAVKSLMRLLKKKRIVVL